MIRISLIGPEIAQTYNPCTIRQFACQGHRSFIFETPTGISKYWSTLMHDPEWKSWSSWTMQVCPCSTRWGSARSFGSWVCVHSSWEFEVCMNGSMVKILACLTQCESRNIPVLSSSVPSKPVSIKCSDTFWFFNWKVGFLMDCRMPKKPHIFVGCGNLLT